MVAWSSFDGDMNMLLPQHGDSNSAHPTMDATTALSAPVAEKIAITIYYLVNHAALHYYSMNVCCFKAD